VLPNRSLSLQRAHRPRHRPDLRSQQKRHGRTSPRSRLTCRIGECSRLPLGLAVSGCEHPVACVDELLDESGPRFGSRVIGRIVGVHDRWYQRRRSDTGPIIIYRLHRSGFQCSIDERTERVVIRRRGLRRGNTTVDRHAKADSLPHFCHVLMDERVRESSQRQVPGRCQHFSFGTISDEVQDLLRELDLSAHPRTPTRTFLNRPGAAECPVCATCIGCPFPQFGVPQWIHSSPPASMSRPPQNTGPMPV